MRFILLLVAIALARAQAPACEPENFRVTLGGAFQAGKYAATTSSGCNQAYVVNGGVSGFSFAGGLRENVDEGTLPAFNTPSSGPQQMVGLPVFSAPFCPYVPAVTLGPVLVQPAAPVDVTTPYGFRWPLPFPAEDNWVGGFTTFNIGARPGFTIGLLVELFNATSGMNDVLAAHVLNFDPTEEGLAMCPPQFAGAPITNVTAGIPATPAEFAVAPIQNAAAQATLHYLFPPGTVAPNVTLRAITCFANGDWNVIDLGITPPTGLFGDFLWLVEGVDNYFGTSGESAECESTCEPGPQYCNEGGVCVGIGNVPTDTCGDAFDDNCGEGVCNATSQTCYYQEFNCSVTTPPPPQCHQYVPCNASVGGTCGYEPVLDGTPCVDATDPCGTSPQCVGGTCVSTPIDCPSINGPVPPCATNYMVGADCMCSFTTLPGLNAVCGVGACAANPDSALCLNSPMCRGVGVCSATNHVVCDASGPTAEICGDGIDQDCDGADLPCGGCIVHGDCTVPGHGCITGICNNATGNCSYMLAPMGMLCTPEHFCSDGAAGTCAANGSCVGTPPDCSIPDDPCAVGVCNPQTDACDTTTSIFDGNDCSTFCNIGATCSAGACVGGGPRVCPSSECENVVCNATSEACELASTTADGTACVGGSASTCMADHFCAGGQCHAVNVTCPFQSPMMMPKLSSLSSSSVPSSSMAPMMMMGGGD